MKAEDKLNELINWCRNVGALPGSDCGTLEKILESVTVNRNRSGKRHKNARFAVDLFDKSAMKDWNLLPFGLQDLNDHFQSIVQYFNDRNTPKASSAGDLANYELNFRQELIGKLFVEVMGKMLISPFVCYDDPGQSGVRQIKPVPDLSQAPNIVIDAVDELIEAMDKKDEAKGIATLATEVVETFDGKVKTEFAPDDNPDLKIAGAPEDEDLVDDQTDLSCHRVEVTRFTDPARPEDDDSGKDVILVTFFMEDRDVQKGAKILINDVYGSDAIQIQAFIGARSTFTRRILQKVDTIDTGNKWRGCWVRDGEVLSLDIEHKGETKRFTASEIVEFDPA